ncbi:MAG TPA: transcription termination/antitermination NusG family protein [Saprospiraceae bacterium]|nr:transcription termination/antitermination NusG family protein [Saprospiraceae bacterium]
MAEAWYVIRSKPNKEEFLAGQLSAYGIKVFYPRIRVKTVNPRARKLRAYFPSYLFIDVDLETISLSTLHWMPGAVNLVSFDGQPASVPETLISAVERQVELINTSQKNMLLDLKPGDVVSIQDGPFAGYEAIFDGQVSGRERVRVLLSFLQNRKIPVELRGSQVGRVKRS